MGRVRPVTLLAVIALGAGSAWAQSEDPVARAKTHFEAGRALYELGNYTEAAREFAAGYELVPKPQFLLNLGQCYRKLDQLPQARDMYRRYLSEAPASDPERPQAEQILGEIDRQLAARQAPPPPPPVAAPPRASPPPPSVAATPAAPALTAQAPPRAERKSFLRRNWWIIPVGVAVVGVGVGLGVYFGTRAADPCAGASLTCWDVSK